MCCPDRIPFRVSSTKLWYVVFFVFVCLCPQEMKGEGGGGVISRRPVPRTQFLETIGVHSGCKVQGLISIALALSVGLPRMSDPCHALVPL